MSERYTKLFSLPEQLARHDLNVPVEVVAGALLRDNQNGTVLAQIKYKNISHKSIKSISVNIAAQDANGVEISGVENYAYESLIAAQGDCFGDKVPVIMSDNNAHSFSVDIVSVDFSDGTKWNKLGQETVNIAKEVGAQTVAATKKTAKVAVNILALIVNTLFTFGLVLGDISMIKDFIAAPSAKEGIPMVFGCLATIVSIPGFGRLIFRKKYGIAQRVLRWVIFVAIVAIDVLIMRVVF